MNNVESTNPPQSLYFVYNTREELTADTSDYHNQAHHGGALINVAQLSAGINWGVLPKLHREDTFGGMGFLVSALCDR